MVATIFHYIFAAEAMSASFHLMVPLQAKGGTRAFPVMTMVMIHLILQASNGRKLRHPYTLPETNIAPENRPLEKEIPIGNHHFQGLC